VACLGRVAGKSSQKAARGIERKVEIAITCPVQNDAQYKYKLYDYGFVKEDVKEGSSQQRLALVVKWNGELKNAQGNKKITAFD